MFSPQGYPNGKVVYDFLLSPDETQGVDALYDLEPYRQIFAIFAITSYNSSMKDLDNYLKQMQKTFPMAIVHKIIVFGVPGETALKTNSRHVIPIFSSKAASFTSLETAMCDITSDFLAELAVYMISRKMGSFKSPSIKSLEPGSSGTMSTPLSVHRGYHGSLRRSMLHPSKSSVSKHGSMSLGLTDRSKSKHKGRSIKFTANMYLLAGRISDALREFSEAASVLKAAYDHLWHGSALDGIGVCLVLQAFLEVPINIPTVAINATMHQSDFHSHSQEHLSSSSPSSRPGSPITRTPSAGSEISPSQSNGGGKVYTSDVTPTAHVVQPSYALQGFLPELTEAILRLYSRAGEEPCPQTVYSDTILRLTSLLARSRVGGGWNGAVLSSIVRETQLSYNLTNESPTTQEIGSWCNKLLNLADWGLVPECRVLLGIAGIYSETKQHRKASFYLRELVTKITPSRGTTPTELEQIELIIRMISQSYGSLHGFLTRIATSFAGGDLKAVGCRWNDLALSFFRSCLQLCQAVKDHLGVIFFAGQILRSAADSISSGEQMQTIAAIKGAQELGNRLGIDKSSLEPPYWDQYILRDVRVAPFPDSVPVHRVDEQMSFASVQKRTSVFLYDPLLSRSRKNSINEKNNESDDKGLVEEERSAFIVRMQNPFEFEVRVEHLSFITDPNVVVEVDMLAPGAISLPPMSVHEIMVAGTPHCATTIELLGAKIKVAGCSIGSYYLPSCHFAGKKGQEKIKHIGPLQGSKLAEVQSAEESKGRKKLSFTIAPKQPLLTAQFRGVDHGWINLLEGEKRELCVQVSNHSMLDTNTIFFTHSDSATDSVQAALSMKDLSPTDVFDLEHMLYKEETVKFSGERKQRLLPAQMEEQFLFRIVGRRGLNNATIGVNYGLNEESEKSHLFLRKLSLFLNVTVNASIEIAGFDVCKWKHTLEGLDSSLEWKKEADEHCTLAALIDVRNSWSEALKTRFTSEMALITCTIQPGAVSKIALPINWSPDEDSFSYDTKDIPSLSNKQYVQDQNMMGERGRYHREKFWIREKLLRGLTGEWSSERGDRYGFIDLRGSIRLSREMVSLMKFNPVVVEMSFHPDSHENSAALKEVPVSSQTTVLHTIVTNKSHGPISGTLHITPFVSEGTTLENRVLITGNSDLVIKQIEPGQSINLRTGILFLTRGIYQWTSSVDLYESSKVVARVNQQQPICIKVM